MSTDRQQIQVMSLEEALKRGQASVYDRMADDRTRISDEKQLRFFDCVREQLFDGSLSVETVRIKLHLDRSVSAALGRALGMPLTEYFRDLRIQAFLQIQATVEAAPGRIAYALGFLSMESFLRTFLTVTGRVCRLPNLKTGLPTDLNFATWIRLQRSELTSSEIERLASLVSNCDLRQAPPVESPLNPTISSDALNAWIEAVLICRAQIEREIENLPIQVGSLLRYLTLNLCDSHLTISAARDASGVNDSTVSSQVRFYLGDPPRVLVIKRRLEIAVHLLCETSLTVEEIAEAAGMTYDTLLRYTKEHLKTMPAALRRDMESPPDAWRRLCLGTADSRDRTRVVEILREALPEADDSQKTSEKALVRPVFVEKPSDEKPLRLSSPWEIEENWTDLCDVALMLSSENPNDRSRRKVECWLARSEHARILDRVREIQCAVTCASALERGESPRFELWASWLKVRPRRDHRDDVSLEEWHLIEKNLVDAEIALARWREVDERRCELMSTPNPADFLRGSVYANYLVARNCLDAEFHYCRGTEKGLAQVSAARAISEELLVRHPRPAGALYDLRTLALARQANCYRALTRIVPALAICEDLVRETEVVNSPFVAAQSLALIANTYFDERVDYPKAKQAIDQAINLFGRLDSHLAAEAMLLKAAIQRTLGEKQYIQTITLASSAIEKGRSRLTFETAQTNVLFYLVYENRIEEALQRRNTTWPSTPYLIGVRFMVEGCLDLACENHISAEENFKKSIQTFCRIDRKVNAAISLLYSAELFLRTSRPQSAKDALMEALKLVEEQGHDAWRQDIHRLIISLAKATAAKHIGEIRRLAYQNGGCLGP